MSEQSIPLEPEAQGVNAAGEEISADAANLANVTVGKVTAELVRMSNSAANQVSATEAELRNSAAAQVQAEFSHGDERRNRHASRQGPGPDPVLRWGGSSGESDARSKPGGSDIRPGGGHPRFTSRGGGRQGGPRRSAAHGCFAGGKSGWASRNHGRYAARSAGRPGRWYWHRPGFDPVPAAAGTKEIGATPIRPAVFEFAGSTG